MSGKKPASAPNRPPPPKVGGVSGGISFSFKALEEEDDSDEELVTYTGKFDKQVLEEKERQARALEKERSLSKSPETRVVAESGMHKSPSVKSQNSFEKLIDFKEKIQDTIAKKREEIENYVASKEKEKDTEAKAIAGLSESPKRSTGPDSERYQPTNKEVKKDNEAVEDIGETEYFEPRDEVTETLEDQDEEDEILEITEEYFNPDNEDFSELPGVQPMLRQRKRLQKFRKIKPIVPPPPVALSKLNQKTSEETPVALKESDTTACAKTENESSEQPQQSSQEHVIQLNGAIVPVKKLIIGIAFVLLYLIIPLPSYISGLIAGLVLSSGGWWIYLWVTTPPKPREAIPEDPPLDQLPPLLPLEMKEPKGQDGFYKGWMNEMVHYQPDTYSINQTHSVFVYLEGTTLRLRRPKTSIAKRAMWNEPKPINLEFIHQRHFDIEGSKVLLLPPGLVKKRLWSKKYPICIALANSGQKKTDSAPQTPVMPHDPKPMKSSNSAVEMVHGFEIVDEQKCDTSVLYLFARTCHEKEQWYRRLWSAAKGIPLKNHIQEIRNLVESTGRTRRSSSSDSLRHRRQNSNDSLSSVTTTSSSNVDDIHPGGNNDLRNFVKYMSRLIPRDSSSVPSSPAHSLNGKEKDRDKDSKQADAKTPAPSIGPSVKSIICDQALLPLNALLGRCFYDFLGDKFWAEKVKDKLQKKLSKIHIPYFIEELQISEISLGTEVPVIRRANKPYLDETGFWLDMDVTYSGRFKMTIETKVNLLKLKQAQPDPDPAAQQKQEKKKSAVTDSEEEDSAESSTDEEEESSNLADDSSGQSGGTGKKIMKYINKIAASKYFQSATENKYIKKAMTGVSNTRLILTVEVQKLNGTLAVNIPPPPSDRLWYGFRGNPQLWLVAKPKVGEREVTMSHITEWIEKKLALEFQHVLVMPNMDDLVIPILSAGSDVDAVSAQQPSGTEL